MAVNKGLKSLAGTTPNFSNQGLENAVNELKIGWVIKGSQLDTAIQDNVVLTTSQKNDLKSTIHNIQYLNLGRVFGDLVRHTNTILDGTIVFLANPDTEDTALYGVSAGEFSRDVNDHLGTLNNKFLETEDSSAPVFTSLRESLDFITAANLSEETALETAYDNLRNFINSVVADSTDFQQTLNTFASAVATAHTNLNTALASEPYLTKRTQLSIDQDKIEAQVALETSNLSRIRDYVNGLTNHISFTSLAEDEQLRALMTRISQNADWANYFREYEKNSANINPIYSVGSDSDKTTIIDTILRDSGLPDVLDFVDLEAVANKAKKDSRIDTAGFDRFTVEQQITDACRQLDIKTANRSIYNQSESLLDNLNQRDRDLVANRLDLNQDAETLS